MAWLLHDPNALSDVWPGMCLPRRSLGCTWRQVPPFLPFSVIACSNCVISQQNINDLLFHAVSHLLLQTCLLQDPRLLICLVLLRKPVKACLAASCCMSLAARCKPHTSHTTTQCKACPSDVVQTAKQRPCMVQVSAHGICLVSVG